MLYRTRQSLICSSFWTCIPNVPGGYARSYLMDDFGTMYVVNQLAAGAFFTGSVH